MIWHKTGPRVRNAKKTTLEVDGKPHTFPSQAEASRYLQLKCLQKAGIVKEIELQPVFELQPAYRKCCGHVIDNGEPLLFKKLKKCPICGGKMPITRARVYRADFRVTYADGHQEIEDVKGMETEMFKIKRDFFEFKYPELSIKVVPA